MRLGCCGTLEQAQEIKAAGFDFLEVNVQALLRGDEPSATWDATAPDPEKLPLPIEAANSLVPARRPLIGPKRDLTALQDYVQRIAKRAQRLGIQRLVFGSGAARERPEGVDPETALEQLAEFARMAGQVCAHHEVLLVVEHLNRNETNTLNSLAEARQLCDMVDHPSVQMLVDTYHYGIEGESDAAVLDLGSTLRHVHVAEPVDRIQPGGHGPASAENPKAFDFEDFFQLLRKTGYNERISFEGKWTGPIPEVGHACVDYLRRVWDRVGRAE